MEGEARDRLTINRDVEEANGREADDAAPADRVLRCEYASLLHMVVASAVDNCDLRSLEDGNGKRVREPHGGSVLLQLTFRT